MTRLNLLQRYEEDLAFLVLKLLEDYLTLCIAEALHDDLFSRLRGDAARDVRHALGGYDFTYLSITDNLASVRQSDLRLVVNDIVHDGLENMHRYIA